MSKELIQSARTGDLVRRDRAERIADAMAHNTRANYSHALKVFIAHGYHIPATPGQLADFLELVRDGDGNLYSISTLRLFKAALAYAHRIAGYPDPTTDIEVQAALKGIGQQRKEAGLFVHKQATPLLRDAAVKMLDTNFSSQATDARDFCLIVVGRSGAFRRSELVGIRLEHLMYLNEGVVITIPYSKTNQTGENCDRVYLPRLFKSKYCPVQAIAEWRRVGRVDSGWLFRRIRKGGRICEEAITPHAVDLIMKRRAQLAGLEDLNLSAHSLRAGFATSAAKKHARPDKIKAGGRWRSNTYERYIRDEEFWIDNPIADIW